LDERLTSIIKSHGFVEPSRGLFVTRHDQNVGLLTLDRATYSGQGWTSIFPALAVDSARIARASGRLVSVADPEMGVQPWYRKAFYIHDDVPDDWGELSETEPTTWQRAESDLSGRVLPELIQHTSDEGLRDCWLQHRDPWMSEVRQLAYTCILVRDLGPQERFGELISRLRSKVGADPGGPGVSSILPVLSTLGIEVGPRS
jgi:hypothetical protein